MNGTLRLGLPTVIAIAAPAVVLFGTVPQSTRAGNPVAEACWGERFPTNTGGPSSCCQDGNRTWHIQGGRLLAFREYGAVCREADGKGTNCGVGSNPFVPCAYGPCGAKNVWALEAKELHVFVPTSKPEKCGWEAQNITACPTREDGECRGAIGGFRGYPEPYAGQAENPGATATCTYIRCLVGGTPAM